MKAIRIHIIQHVEFEKPGLIEKWVKENNHSISFSYLYKNQLLPDFKDFDLLLILGGPAGVYETSKFEWIEPEIKFIKECIKRKKAILGICLGAQLLAAALGSEVYKGPHKEIGWLPVTFDSTILSFLPEKLTVFHWHGDTFDIPDGAARFASTEGVPNQAFIYNNNVIALQFHLEVTPANVDLMLENCSDDITSEKYVQTADLIKNRANKPESEKLLFEILNLLSDRIN